MRSSSWERRSPGTTPCRGSQHRRLQPHFVRDIGAAYLVTALGLAWFAWRPAQGWPALVAGAVFLALHSGIHLFDASCSASPLANLIRDLPGVFLPTLLAAWIALVRRPKES
uniref:Uncharacterized protein n=1 Tax=Phenylobacterium glaciei TaxID=2803784 RepID=A0A974S8C9_9CAUL|nr:hypothetical protein JKL49_21100 [Phenylobacterium glaciei]